MKNLLLFLFRARLLNFIAANKKPVVFVVNIILLFVCAGNVTAILYILGYFNDKNDTEALSHIFYGIDCLIFIISVVQVFIPVLRRRTKIFTNSDPWHEITKTIIETVYNLVSPFFVLIVFSLLILFIFSPVFTLYHLMHAFAVTIFSGMLSILIQSIFSQPMKIKLLGLLYLAVVLAAAYTLHGAAIQDLLIIAAIPLSLAVFHFTRLQEDTFAEQAVKIQHRRKTYIELLFTLCFKTKTFRLNIILAIVFKTVFLLIFFTKPLSQETFAAAFFKWLIISPLVYFTYVYNNMWGYFQAAYKLFAQRRTVLFLFASYIRLCSVILIVDAALTFFILLYFKPPVFSSFDHAAIFYLATAVSLLYIGFYSSLSRPFEVKKFLDFASFKSNTPLQYNLISMLIVFGAGYVADKKIGIYILCAAIGIVFYLNYSQIVKGKITDDVKNIFNVI